MIGACVAPTVVSSARSQQSRTRLILLGTGGGPTPKKTVSAPATLIIANDSPYLIDCGNGVARQWVLADVPLLKLRHIFITHQHSDHNVDYGNLILLAWATGLTTRVDSWGPPPLAKMTKLFLEMNAYDIQVRMKDEGRRPLQPLIHPHAGLGVVLQKMGRLDEAVDEYERALALNPHFSEARSNLIIAREQLGISQAANDRFDEAAATLRLVLQEAPDRAAAHRELAYALLRLGRTDDSIAHAREAIRLEPASPDNHGTLAEIWRDLHRQNEAIAEYQEAVRLAPTSAEWHNNLGAALLDADRLEDAVREFRDAVRWDPRSPQAHRNLGVALAQMGQPQEAAVHLREALRLQPDFPDAQANLDEITGRVRKD